MSKHETTTREDGSNVISFRAPESLRERLDDRVESSDEHASRTDVIREACRQFCLDAEVRERLDVDETTTQARFADGGESR